MLYFVLLSVSIFPNTKINVVTNLNLPNSVFLIADSVSLNCSSGLKEFKTSTLQEPLKACARSVVFIFFGSKSFHFFLYHYMKSY